MNSQVLGLKVAGVIFALMFLAQLLRLIIRPEVLIAGNHVPLWPSAIAAVLLAGLSIWMWLLTRKTTK